MPLEGGRLWQTSEIYSIFWTDSSKFQSIVCFGHVLLLSSGKLTRISMTNIWKIIVYNCLTSLNQNLEFTKIHKKFARSFLTEQNVFHFLSKLNVDNMYSSWVKYFWPRWPPPPLPPQDGSSQGLGQEEEYNLSSTTIPWLDAFTDGTQKRLLAFNRGQSQWGSHS